jgi:hypothetical protein
LRTEPLAMKYLFQHRARAVLSLMARDKWGPGKKDDHQDKVRDFTL